jgi:anti-sigma factor RsiW
MLCRLVKPKLTALADGELSGWSERLTRSHLRKCTPCRAEVAALRAAIVQQTQALRALQAAQPSLDSQLWQDLRRALTASRSEDSTLWTWLRPVALAASVTIASLVGLVSAAGGPQAVLVPLGIQPPPPPVSRAPQLFQEYPLIEKLELLEHFETVDRIRLEEDGESQSG